MERLYTSRKLWGAILGTLSISFLIAITPKEVLGTVVTVVGGMWGAAITTQGIKDIRSNAREGL